MVVVALLVEVLDVLVLMVVFAHWPVAEDLPPLALVMALATRESAAKRNNDVC